MSINFFSQKLRKKNPTREEMQMNVYWLYKISRDREDIVNAARKRAAAGNGINLFLSSLSCRAKSVQG